METVLYPGYQSKYHYYSMHTKQSNELQYQNAHRDLLHIPHP